MKYFNHCSTLEEVKDTYKKLAFEHHPDRGGDTATMQAINAEYAYASALLLKGANLSQNAAEREIKFSEEYRRIIEQIIHLPNIKIELIGLWIWVSGKTKPVHKELGAAGLFYAPKKKVWYYRSADLKERRGGRKTLDQIRAKYGSKEVREDKAQPTSRHLIHS